MSLHKRLGNLASITVRGKKYDLNDEVMIDEDNLNEHYINQIEKVMAWGRLKASEHSRLRRLEDELDELTNLRFIQFRQLYEEEDRDFTDSLLRAEVASNEDVVKMRKEVRKARAKVDALAVICNVLEHRKSMLLQLGATNRRENDPISIRERRKGNG